MASVDMQTTESAQVGNQVEALLWNLNDERKFEVTVRPFGLVVDEDPERGEGVGDDGDRSNIDVEWDSDVDDDEENEEDESVLVTSNDYPMQFPTVKFI